MGNDILDWLTDYILPWVAILAIVFIVLIVPVLIYGAIKSNESPTFELRKDRWRCTASHPVTTTTYVMVGKVLMPISSTHNECDQWSVQP